MKIDTKILLGALKELKPIIPMASQVPITSCVLIETGSVFKMTVTDFDQTSCRVLPFNGESDFFCVNFNHLLFSIGDAEETMMVREDESFVVKCGQKSSKLALIDPKDFPDDPELEKFTLIGTNPNDIAIGMKAVHGFEHRERDPLTGMSVRGSAKLIECLASDGMNLCRWSSAMICADFEAIVPAKFCDALADALERANAQLRLSNNMALISWDDGFFACKLAEGKYPPSSIFTGRKLEKIGKLTIRPLLRELEACIALTPTANTPQMALYFMANKLETAFLGTNENEFVGEFNSFKYLVNAKSMKLCLSALGESCEISGDENMLKLSNQDVEVFTSLMR